jgi:HAE1 family hydrophobic/amphiphilic exporter-1
VNAELPAHIRLRTVVDRSTFIRNSVEDVQTTLVLGGLLTVFIVFLFLNSWRSTVITGLALPVSVISTFIIMRALGFTLNILTLMGLSLAIGLLIDDAIVVRENIVRHMHAGADHFTAAREATAEIGLAVMATTFTIIAVFVPVAFMGGIIGRFFYQFGITVGFAVLISLFVSFTIDPMLSSRWYDPAADPNVPRSAFGRGLGKLNDQLDRLQNVLATALGWSLSHRWAVVLLAFVAVFSSFFIFGKLGSAFMPTADPGQFQVAYKATPGISLDRSAEIARELETEIRHNPGVAYTYTTIGGNAAKPLNEGNIFIRLTPRKTREHFSFIKSEVRSKLARFRAVTTPIEEADRVGGDTKPIQISLRTSDLARLAPAGERLMAEVKQVSGAADVDTSEEQPQAEVRVEVNRNAAADLGLDLGTVASTVRGLVAGEVVSQFEDPDGDSYDVRLGGPSIAHTCHGPDGARSAGPGWARAGTSQPGGTSGNRCGPVQDPPPRPAAGSAHHRWHGRPLAGRGSQRHQAARGCHEAAAKLPDRLYRRFRADGGELRLCHAVAGAGDCADLRHPGIAVPQLPATVRDYAFAAALAAGRGRHVVPGTRHVEHDVHDRRDFADGPGD